jgi:rod shape-determining protein MreC
MKSISNRSFQSVVFIIVTVGIILMALGGYLTPVSKVVLDPLIRIQAWIGIRYQTIQSYITAPADVASLRQQNTELEAEIARLQVQNIELQEQVQESQMLSTLVDYARSRPENRYLAASVIGRDISPFMRYIVIDRGSDDDIRRGMPVVTNQGLVGQIAAVTAGAARVQLITDPESSVNVILQQSGAEAVLKGQINGELVLEFIPQDVNVQPGELVITSGLGGNYPPNLVIGQVSSVRSRPYDLFQSASVQQAVDFSNLDIVLIIINFRPIDFTPLITTPSAP